MTVAELILKLQECDPDAQVVYWPDTHESNGYTIATDVARVWVRMDGSDELRSSREPKEGYVPAIEVV